MLLLNFPSQVLTGTFGAEGNWDSSACSLTDIMSNIQGKVDIVGVGGNISPMLLLGSQHRNIVGVFGFSENLLNIDIGKGLAQILSNIHYDKMFASVIWQNRTNVTLDNFVITGDNVRIISSGKLIGTMGMPFRDNGVYFETQINAKNDVMDIFDRFGWSSGGFDYCGYKIGPRIVIRGTVGNLDFSDAKKMLASAGAKVLLEHNEGPQVSPILNPAETLMKVFQK
jgi:hypothetical protein